MRPPDRNTRTSSGSDEISVEWEQLPLALQGPAQSDRDAVPRETHPHIRRSNRFLWGSRVVILAGLLVLGFAGVRYWQDEVVTARHQRQLSAEFERRTDLVQAGMPPAALTSDSTSRTPPHQEEVSTAIDGDDPRMVLPSSVYTEQEIAASAPEEPHIPSILREGAPAGGEVAGRITIPEIDLDWMFVEGVDLADLAIGPGHMPWTEEGDLIYVETLIGIHIYSVTESLIVPPTGVWVTKQWEGAWLTLTTCNPKYSSRERLIVFAEMIDGPNAESIFAVTENVAPQEPDGA
jgi:sortase A